MPNCQTSPWKWESFIRSWRIQWLLCSLPKGTGKWPLTIVCIWWNVLFLLDDRSWRINGNFSPFCPFLVFFLELKLVQPIFMCTCYRMALRINLCYCCDCIWILNELIICCECVNITIIIYVRCDSCIHIQRDYNDYEWLIPYVWTNEVLLFATIAEWNMLSCANFVVPSSSWGIVIW